MASEDHLTAELRATRARVREFVDAEVIPLEGVLERRDEASSTAMADLKQAAKDAGLWALGHPVAIGGQGMPFLNFVYINEVIGRSEFAQVAVGTVSMRPPTSKRPA